MTKCCINCGVDVNEAFQTEYCSVKCYDQWIRKNYTDTQIIEDI